MKRQAGRARRLLEKASRNWWLMILLAMCVKGADGVQRIRNAEQAVSPGAIHLPIGDTPSYLDPIENLITHGTYDPDYRMPGVGAPYYLFRQFLSPVASQDAYVVLQWLLSSISVYLLALIALRFSGSSAIFLGVFILYMLSTFTTMYDVMVGSDSLAASTLIIFLFLIQKGHAENSGMALLGSGFFLTWAIFLRPVLAPILLMSLILLFIYNRGRWRTLKMVFFLIPFLMIDGAWTIRNHAVNGTISPLTNEGLFAGSFAKGIKYSIMDFIQGYGGDYIWWNPGADIRWYGVWSQLGHEDREGLDATPPPPHAYAEGYDRADLEFIRDQVRSLEHAPDADSTLVQQVVVDRMRAYSEMYRKGRPFQYHVLSRLRMLVRILAQNGTESMMPYPFAQLPLWARAYKLIQAGLYLFVFSAGIIGLLVLGFRIGRYSYFLGWALPAVAAYTILVYPILLRLCEWRYLATAFPFTLVLAVWFVHLLFRRGAESTVTEKIHTNLADT